MCDNGGMATEDTTNQNNADDGVIDTPDTPDTTPKKRTTRRTTKIKPGDTVIATAATPNVYFTPGAEQTVEATDFLIDLAAKGYVVLKKVD